MCGIVGFNWPDLNMVSDMNETLNHRGPEGSGVYADRNVSFAHKRLSIQDLSIAGNQPMLYSKESGACSDNYNNQHILHCNYVVNYNGEIYNCKEIRKDLESKNYVFTTSCDTEVLLASYLEWGEKCVERFNGMWAFCIYDKIKEILFLSRDRFGTKPLYFYCKDSKFVFASELKPFFKLKIPFLVNPKALNHFLAYNATPIRSSIIQDVNKLESGYCLIFDLKTKEIKKYYNYWKTEFVPINIEIKEAKKQIYKLLDDSVKARLLADVQVGAFLSGGLDSSVLVYFMSKYIPELNTYSIKFDYKDFNESNYAKIVSQKFKTLHHEIEFNSYAIKEIIPKLPYFYDEPFGDESMIPTFLVSQVAAINTKVVLTGCGSDEIFAGYGRYREFLLLSKLLKFPKFVKESIVKIYKLKDPVVSFKLKELLFSKNPQEMYLKLMSGLFRGFDNSFFDSNILNDLYRFFDNKSNLNGILNFDQNHYLVEDIQTKVDRATMASSIEGRFPFLDFRLVEYVNNLPMEFKYHKTGKFILKEIFKDILPREIVYRKKQGFGVPIKHYFRNELKEFAREIIFDFSDYDYYNKDETMKIWNLYQAGKADYSSYFWNIIMFNMWYKMWQY